MYGVWEVVCGVDSRQIQWTTTTSEAGGRTAMSRTGSSMSESMLWIARPARHLSACHDHDGLNDSTGKISWERDLIK